MNNEIKTFQYEGNAITFNIGEGVMVNATEMAKAFGKKPSDFLKTQSTKEFIEVLSASKKIEPTDLVKVTNGGENFGTWMHEDVALEFARWLSPKFAIWCNDKIKELLKTGHTSLVSDDDSLLMAKAIILADKKIKQQEKQIEEQLHEINKLTPLAEYTNEVLQSDSTYTLTQVSKDLGFRSVYTFQDWAKGKGILYKQSGQWLPTAKYSGKGYFTTRTAKYVKNNNEIGSSISTVVTESGRLFLHSIVEPQKVKGYGE